MDEAAPSPASDADTRGFDGRCIRGEVRDRLATRPLFVHCCHCRWCQRESGAAFAINALIESDRLVVESGTPEAVDTPSESGEGQRIARCPRCRVALWSHHAGAGPLFAFVRVGTLDTPDAPAPDLHIFTASKQRRVVLPPAVPAVAGYYDRDRRWPADSLARRRALAPRIDAWRAGRARRAAARSADS